jgi:hypothetical protein
MISFLTYGFKYGHSIGSDVSTRSETQPTNETGAKVTEDVPIEIGHNKHIKYRRFSYQLE